MIMNGRESGVNNISKQRRRELLKVTPLVLAGLVGSTAALGIGRRLPRVNAIQYDTTNFSQFLDQGSDPAAPPSGQTRIYTKSGVLYTESPTIISQILSNQTIGQASSYIISQVGSTYYATPAPNSGLAAITPNTDAYSVIQACINALTHGGLIHLAANTTFTLSNTISFTAGDAGYPAWADYEWILEGEGYSTVLSQNTSGKSAITVKNGTCVTLRNFRITVGTSAQHGIFLDGSGSPTASIWTGAIDRIWITGGSSGNYLLYAVNPCYSTFDRIYLNASTSGCVPFRLYNSDSSHHYGNCKFGYMMIGVNFAGGASDGIQISGVNDGGSLDLCTFENIQLLSGINTGGTKGINIGNSVDMLTFEYVSIEGFDYGIYVGGTSTFARQIHFNSGYTDGRTAEIYCGSYSMGCKFKHFCLATGIVNDQGGAYGNPPNTFEDFYFNDGGAGTVTIGGSSGSFFRGTAGDHFFSNTGTATITAGKTSIVVTHSLVTKPRLAPRISPTTDTGGVRYWVSAVGATTFTITISATSTSNISFVWDGAV
jgi:hypothetical protein